LLGFLTESYITLTCGVIHVVSRIPGFFGATSYFLKTKTPKGQTLKKKKKKKIESVALRGNRTTPKTNGVAETPQTLFFFFCWFLFSFWIFYFFFKKKYDMTLKNPGVLKPHVPHHV
jgi:hypothetical protein